ncbi:DMT family transporter [Kiloniella sp. b19]|uniref:DMT family transporter n=1 Tax=Kiloniella sp. GXU_MW_B19 TaxID=3141326 RepID=UPI0031E06BEF
MFLFPVLAAVGASLGWATGIVLAQKPARLLGAFEFTRVQLITCGAITAALCAGLGYWNSFVGDHWGAFAVSILFGIVLGNLAMIQCLRLGGPRRTELLLALKAPLVGTLAFFWLGELPELSDLAGAAITLSGVVLAILRGGDEDADSDRLGGSLVVVVLLGLCAALFQGVGFLIMKPVMLAGMEPLAVTAVRLLGAALVISLIALWPLPAFRSGAELAPGLLFRTVLPGFIGYVVSSSLLLYAIASFNAGVATVLGALSPVLVLPILWFRDGRRPRAFALLGACLCVAGTAVIVLV